MKKIPNLILMLFCGLQLVAQSPEALKAELEAVQNRLRGLRHEFNSLEKAIDDILWHQKLGEVAHIDKVQLTGPPIGAEKAEGYGGAGNPVYFTNPLRFKTYIFIPRSVNPDQRYPLLVFPHGGVHSDFNTGYFHIVKELMAQGYIVVAPEYRGSTGYGRRFYQTIDYGGKEIQDVKASRDYMLENYSGLIDADRIGILGWSHGGLITLMNLFEHPDAYEVGYAGVPVSDLIARMGYKTQGYRELYSVDYHIGKTAHEDPEEYQRRSPAWQAHKLETPLLIHTNTNDSDVNVLEVEHLIKALKAADKAFEYEIYEDKPGGHRFDRMDTMFAKKVRLKVYRFLAGYLNPPTPFTNLKALQRASYGF